MAEPRKFPHHLIREIFEQPDALRRTIEPRVSLAGGLVRLDEVHISREELRALRRINIVASGTRDRKSTRLNSSHRMPSRMPSSA